MTNGKRQYHCVECVGQVHIELAEREVLEVVAQLHAGMNNGELLTNTRNSARPGFVKMLPFNMH